MALGDPKSEKIERQVSKSYPKGTKSEPKGTKSEPKVSQQGSKREPKGAKRDQNGDQIEHKRQGRGKYSFLVAKAYVFWLPFGMNFHQKSIKTQCENRCRKNMKFH